MPSITIRRKDGTVQTFEEVGRSGGSYSLSLRFEGNFAIITDEWGKQTAIPASEIEQITQDAPRRSW